MVQLNLALREINCKVVYFGCGLGGKTTNLEIVHEKAAPENRGDLTSIATESDRTLFFDFMPLDLGTVSGMRVKFQLYTVPGQVYYNSTRKLVLRGADGVIFVADSQRDKLDENIESLDNLEECLSEQGRSLEEMPHVVQFNKRDLDNLLSIDEMKDKLNRYDAPCYEAVAFKGDGVLETFKALAAMMLDKVKAMSTDSAAKPGGRAQRLGGDRAKREQTDAQRLQGGIQATPAKAQPVADVENAPRRGTPVRPMPVQAPKLDVPNEPAARSLNEPAARSFEKPAASIPNEPAPRAVPNEPSMREFPKDSAAQATPPMEPSPRVPSQPMAGAAPEVPEAKKPAMMPEMTEPETTTATRERERVQPSVRRPREKAAEQPAEPKSNRSLSKHTTGAVRVAGAGVMITTSARRKAKSGKLGIILGVVGALAVGAAAAWYFLLR